MRECEFCAIGAGKAPATVVWQDERNVAFFPLRPAVVGHTLVIPRDHYDDLFEVTETSLSSLVQAASLVGKGLRAALHADGMNLINSAGKAASQSVFHVHLHLVPRWEGDRFGDIWPPSEPWAGEVKAEIAELVRRQLRPQ
ncbi:HIT family protein [Streptomyces sp. NPDC001902]